MDTSDWITLGAAILVGGGTLFLGIMAWRAIRQTRSIQKAERRERVLNEIIQWAVDVSARMSPIDMLKNPEWLLGTKLDTEETFRFVQIYGCLDLMSQYSVSQLRGEYISQIASRIRNDLGGAVDDLINKIEEHLKLLLGGAEHTVELEEYGTLIDIIFKGKSELRAGLSEDAKHQVAIFDDRVELNNSATRVIEIAVEIKTKDIEQEEQNMSKEDEATGSNEITLDYIERHLRRRDRQMQWQWLFSLGVSAMAVGTTWVIATTPRTPGDLRAGLFVFSIGLVISLISLFYRYRKKS